MFTTPKHLAILALILAQLVDFIQAGGYSYKDNWVYLTKYMDLPDNVVFGGIDSDGYNNYVGRNFYSSSAVPARVVPELGLSKFNTDTLASEANTYEVLVANATLGYKWIRSYDGYREKNAVSVGTNSADEPVYICRARCDNGLLIGTLFLSKRYCIIKSGTLPVRQFDKYEILIRNRMLEPLMPFELNLIKN